MGCHHLRLRARTKFFQRMAPALYTSGPQGFFTSPSVVLAFPVTIVALLLAAVAQLVPTIATTSPSRVEYLDTDRSSSRTYPTARLLTRPILISCDDGAIPEDRIRTLAFRARKLFRQCLRAWLGFSSRAP